MPRQTLIQVRRDTEANWAGTILADGEIGYTNSGTNKGKFKIGDGATVWGSLAYQGGGGSYTLPTASTTTLGGVRIDGTTITISSGVISANSNFVSSVSGTGTVSGLTLSGTVTSTGSLTLGGTLSVTPSNFANQTANLIFAGPASGSSAAPSFRQLAAADFASGATPGQVPYVTTSGTLWGWANPVVKDGNSNIQVNNVQKGYTSVTSAGTTTTLTAASTYVQRITGTNTQIIQLPDTTTLTNGHVFIIDNDSTGAVTVNTSTATLLDTVSPGAMGYFFVEDNTVNTVAGWGKYAYLPGTVDWGTSSVTGVPSVTTSAANFSLLTPTTNSLTLDSGTTGAVNLGTNANAKTITIGNTTSGTSLSFQSQGAVNTSFNFSGSSAAVLQTPGGTGNPTQNLTIQSGTTSQSTTSNTNSGSLTITTGSAANTNGGSGNATSGSITMDVGAASAVGGSQTNGSISIGGSNAASVAIGRSGVTTTINGTVSFGTLSGALTLRSGSTGVGTAPLYFGNSSPAVLATPVAGAFEYDGKLVYATPFITNTTVGRGLIPATQYVLNSSAVSLTATTTSPATPVTATGAIFGKSLYLEANTTYEIEAMISSSTQAGTTTGTNYNLIWAFQSGASAAIHVEYQTGLAAQTTQSSTTAWQMVTAGNTATIAASISTTIAYHRFRFKGIIKTSSTAGNFTVSWGVTSGGATIGSTANATTLTNSFMKVRPIGTTTDVNIGGWA